MSDLGKRLGDAAARPGLAILASEDQGVGTDDQIEQLHQAVMRTSPNFSNSSKSIRMVPKLVIAQQKRIGDTRADFDPMLRRYVTPAGLIGTTRADFRAQSFDRNYFFANRIRRGGRCRRCREPRPWRCGGVPCRVRGRPFGRPRRAATLGRG